MADTSSISPWSSLVNSRFSESALSRVPRGSHLQTMDSELDSLMQAVLQARRMRNMKAGPCTLPAEILAYILECVQPAWSPRREQSKSGDTVFCAGWMSVSHVCTFWREVALGTPSLWSKPTLDILSIPHQYIPDILFRSKSTLFDMRLRWTDKAALMLNDSGLNAWFSPTICRRARRLDITAEMGLVEFAAEHLPPSQYMDQLRELSVEVYDIEQDPDLPVPFHHLLGLTSLTLTCCQVPWQSSLFSSQLRNLSFTQGGSQFQPSYDEISALMARLHALETLYWEDIVPRTQPSGGHAPAISLPKSLRQLTLLVGFEGMAMDCLELISHISTPPQCARNHSIPEILEFDLDPDEIGDTMGRILAGLSFAECDYIEGRYLDLLSGHIRIIGSILASPQYTPPHSHLLQANSKFIINRLDIPAFDYDSPPFSFRLSNYLSLLALERLHTISLDIPTIRDLGEHDLWPSLLRADRVHRIAVMRPYAKTMRAHLSQLLNALGRRHVRESGDKLERHILFPHLEILALPLIEGEAQYGDVFVDLVSLVQARETLGAPLRELVVPKSTTNWSVWSTLRPVLKVSFIDYPRNTSPMSPESM
ncbi:hypothetical protein PENSPDRAFT_754018 [Peniophora sp. CONT]|nr:hypothetical protein PENSPDRAFT_754018 [Peniophora sp. CONT]